MLDAEGYYSNDKTTIIPINDLFLLGVLNSKISDFYISLISSTKQGGYFEYKPMYIQKTPIPRVDMDSPKQKDMHDRMVEMVEQMLALNKQLAAANTAHEKTALQRQIDATDHQIDQLVYDLYGLTEDEIAIVEGG